MADEKGKVEAPQQASTPIEQRLKVVEDVIFELIDKFEKFTQEFESFKKGVVTKPKGLFGGKREPVPIKDLVTGEVYPSMSAVNKAIGPEIGIDPYVKTMGYYEIEKKLRMEDGSPRFVPAPEDEAKAAREKYQAELEAEIAKANAEAAESKEPATAESKKKK